MMNSGCTLEDILLFPHHRKRLRNPERTDTQKLFHTVKEQFQLIVISLQIILFTNSYIINAGYIGWL